MMDPLKLNKLRRRWRIMEKSSADRGNAQYFRRRNVGKRSCGGASGSIRGAIEQHRTQQDREHGEEHK